MIQTAIGPLEEHLLEKRIKTHENDRTRTINTEYWFMGQLVKNDLDIQLKQGLGMAGTHGAFR